MNTVCAKVVILGTQGVGKTSLVTRYESDIFQPRTSSTIGASFSNFTITTNGYKIKMQVWDTAGQERFRSMLPMYYRGANAAIFVFDLTNYSTFTDVQAWVQDLESEFGTNEVKLIVTGNKCDLIDQRRVEYSTAVKYTDSIQAAYFETSALTTTGVLAMFQHVGTALAQQAAESATKSLNNSHNTSQNAEDSNLHNLSDASVASTKAQARCCR